jgi:hypothetical protein
MKKIIAIDFHVLQKFNAPHRLNLDLLTELATYIDDPDCQVFIYITRPLKNRAIMLQTLQQEKIIGSDLENRAKIVDFSQKKDHQIVQSHIRELKDNNNEISEFIVIGLPHSQRFHWLQEMNASIVDWEESSEQNLTAVLNQQLELGEQSVKINSFFNENQHGAQIGRFAFESLPRDKREWLTTSHPNINPWPVSGCCNQILEEMHVLKDLIEEENLFPEYISLRNFHYANLLFDVIHFSLEVFSVIFIIIHLYRSSKLESHLKEWFKKSNEEAALQETNLSTMASPELVRESEVMSDQVTLSMVAPEHSSETECHEADLSATSQGSTIIPIDPFSEELSKNNKKLCQEKLVAKPQFVSSQKSLVHLSEECSLSKSSTPSSGDSRLSVKSSPACYVSQLGPTTPLSSTGATCSQLAKKRASSAESFLWPSSQRQRMRAKSAIVLQELSFPRIKKVDFSQDFKEVAAQKKMLKEACMVDINNDDEKSVLIPEKSTLTDYRAMNTHLLTSRRVVLVKSKNVANQENFSEGLANTRSKHSP